LRVFKYRGGDQVVFKRDLDALKNHSFWASQIETLNDPCEGFVTSDWLEEMIDLCHEPVEAKKLRGGLKRALSTRNKFGIYSLSTSSIDELLWAHYAYNHKGFCIEYDLDDLLRNLIDRDAWLHRTGRVNESCHFNIQYANEVPRMDPYDLASINNDIKYIQKLFGWKSQRWAYERELRIITPLSGLHYYEKNAVRAIHFGLRMPGQNKESILTAMDGESIEFYQMELKLGTYQLESKRI
jgi:Protein of unknown function (DUF2971)